jgi:hypothetical protein
VLGMIPVSAIEPPSATHCNSGTSADLRRVLMRTAHDRRTTGDPRVGPPAD